jgi:hypothetical protein
MRRPPSSLVLSLYLLSLGFNYDLMPITKKPVKMETVEFYADLKGAVAAGGSQPIPIFSETKLTPYDGPQTGSVNTTYSQYIAGTPLASKFVIAGVDTCPESKNCQIELWQSHRLATRRSESFYFHQ